MLALILSVSGLGFRVWLEATGPRRISDGLVTFEAAQAYMQTGRREFPFDGPSGVEAVDEGPHRAARGAKVRFEVVQRFGGGEVDSESSSTSTTDPSSSVVIPESDGDTVPGLSFGGGAASEPGLGRCS